MHGLSYRDVMVVTKIIIWHSTIVSRSKVNRQFGCRRSIARVRRPAERLKDTNRGFAPLLWAKPPRETRPGLVSGSGPFICIPGSASAEGGLTRVTCPYRLSETVDCPQIELFTQSRGIGPQLLLQYCCSRSSAAESPAVDRSKSRD
jgi:hypothetical protein